MSIPPGSEEYPPIKCPSCDRVYNLAQLEISEDDPPVYYCPNCESKVYEIDQKST